MITTTTTTTNERIKALLPFIRKVVGSLKRRYPTTIEVDDLVQECSLVTLKYLEWYDANLPELDQNYNFEIGLTSRIRYKFLDCMRNHQHGTDRMSAGRCAWKVGTPYSYELDENAHLSNNVCPSVTYEAKQLLERVSGMHDERKKEIILRRLAGYNVYETAKLLGVTSGRVSQIFNEWSDKIKESH